MGENTKDERNRSESDWLKELPGWLELSELSAAEAMEKLTGLVDSGVSLTAVDEKGRGVLAYLAEEREFADYFNRAIPYIIAQGADPHAKVHKNPFLFCCGDHLPALRSVIEAGVAVDTPRAAGQTLLNEVCCNGETADKGEIVQYLLAAGADPDAALQGDWRTGWTPLLWAASRGEVDVAELLLNAGAEIDRVALDGTNALAVALSGGHTQVVALLEEHGATATESVRLKHRVLGHARNENWSEVLGIADKAIRHNPEEIELYLQKAHALYFAEQDYAKVEEVVTGILSGNKAEETDPALNPFLNPLLNILLMSLMRREQFSRAIDLFHIHAERIVWQEPLADNILVNLMMAYGQSRRAKVGLEELAPYLELVLVPEKGRPAFHFNRACLNAMAGNRADALLDVLHCLIEGRSPDDFRRDEDFESLWKDGVFNRLLDFDFNGPMSASEFRCDTGSQTFREISLHRWVFRRKQGHIDVYDTPAAEQEIFEPDHDRRHHALLRYLAAHAAQERFGEVQLSPHEKGWVKELRGVFSALRRAQTAGEFTELPGGLKFEWDFNYGDAEHPERPHHFVLEGFANADQAQKQYATYRGIDEHCLHEGLSVYYPSIISARAFVNIIRELLKTDEYGSLEKAQVFFMAYEEHDSTVEFSAMIEGDEVRLL